MGKCVVTDLESIFENPLEDGNIAFCLQTYNKKCSRNFFFLKNVKYLWSEFFTGTIIKSEDQLLHAWHMSRATVHEGGSSQEA